MSQITINPDTPESRRQMHQRREQRMVLLDKPKKAVAVFVCFEDKEFIVRAGSLTKSISVAKNILHKLIHESNNSSDWTALPQHATIEPITAQRLRQLQECGQLAISPTEYERYKNHIVLTCYDTIRNCNDASVRLQAARVLQEIGTVGDGAAH